MKVSSTFTQERAEQPLPRAFRSAACTCVLISLFLLLLPFSAVSQTTAAVDEQEIIIMFECMGWSAKDQVYEATFGFNNPNKETIEIAAANFQLSCPGATVSPEVIEIKPGRIFSAFKIKFTCPSIDLTVRWPSGKLKSLTVNSSSTTCVGSENIIPNLSISPLKTDKKIDGYLELLLDPTRVVSTDLVYQIEEAAGIRYVFVQFIALEGQTALLLAQLAGLGSESFIDPKSDGLQITGWLDISLLSIVEGWDTFQKLSAISPPILNGGLVTSRGDSAQRTALVRTAFKLDGRGMKIGVLSDSYNGLLDNPAQTGVLNGDLPGLTNPINPIPVQVLKDLPASSGLGTDEGRAMIEIINDVAPAAQLAFHTAFDGPIDFAEGIRALKAAGCNILVDDITYPLEPFFEDGVVARAVNEVVSQGATYFTSAGNFGDNAHADTFRPLLLPDNSWVHNFNGAGDYLQRVYLPKGSYTLVMQWASSVPQDFDIYLTNEAGQPIVGYNSNSTYPAEAMTFHVGEGGATANIMVVNATAGIPAAGTFFKYIFFMGEAQIGEYVTGTSTITGHANAAGAIAVGAANYQKTPRYGTNPPVIATYSSTGGTPIVQRDASGALSFEMRNKPDFVGPDGGNVSFLFPGAPNDDGDTFSNFYGTSASAPHAAAAAALIMQARTKFIGDNLSPTGIRSLMSTTALDMHTPGRDNISGVGFIRPDMAISTFAQPSSILTGLSPTYTIRPIPALTRLEAGQEIIVKGEYLSTASRLYINSIVNNNVSATLRDPNTLVFTVVNTIEFSGNPPVQLYNAPITAGAQDGGLSNALYFYPKTKVVVQAGNATKRYADRMPTFNASISPAVEGFTTAAITFSTTATDLSSVGAYVISPAITAGHPILAQTNLYDFIFENGVLQVEKVPLVVKVNDLALAQGQAIQGFTFQYNFTQPVNNESSQIALIKENLRQQHAAGMTIAIAVLDNLPPFELAWLENRSFLANTTAINNAQVVGPNRVVPVSSLALSQLSDPSLDLEISDLINNQYLINLRLANLRLANLRLANLRLANLRLANTAVISTDFTENNNKQTVLILENPDELASSTNSINLVTGTGLGEHYICPGTLLTNNANISYQTGNLFINPVGVGVKAVKPILECIQPSNNTGYFIAHFWYDNPNAETVRLPDGGENILVYEGTAALCYVNNTSKPRVFKPGKNYAFSVEFDGSKLSWTLTSYQGNKKTAIGSTASSTSSRCKKVYTITKPCIRTSTAASRIAANEEAAAESVNEVSLYPNPVKGTLYVDVTGFGAASVKVSVSDLLGRMQLPAREHPTSRGPLKIDMSTHQPGIYLLKIEGNGVARQFRVLKQ